MATHLSRRETAVALGISRQALEKHIKAGRIEETGRGIDIDKARAAHAAIRAAAPAPARLVQPPPPAPQDPPPAEPAEPSARKPYNVPRGAVKATAASQPATDADDAQPAGSIFDLTAARARKEHWNAERARQAYDIANGRLIPREEVERKEAQVARTFRDQILALKGDLLPKLPTHLRGDVDERLDQFLNDLQQACARIAEEIAPKSA